MEQAEDFPSINLAQNSPFQVALGQAGAAGGLKANLKAVAQQFTASAGYVSDLQNLPLLAQLKKLRAELNTLERRDKITDAQIGSAVEAALGARPRQLIAANTLVPAVTAIRDTMVAIKYLPEEHHKPIEQLGNFLRDLEVVIKAGGTAGFPGDSATLRRYRRRSFLFPVPGQLGSVLSTDDRKKKLDKVREAEESKKRKLAEDSLDRYQKLDAAVRELASIGNEQFETTPQQPIPGFMPPLELRAMQGATREANYREQWSLLSLQTAKTEMLCESRSKGSSKGEGTAGKLGAVLLGGSPVMTGSSDFKPVSGSGLKLKAGAEKMLAANTLALLKERSLSPSEHGVDFMVEKLRSERHELTKEIDELMGRPVRRSLKRVGNTMISIATPMASYWNNIVIGGLKGLGFLFLEDSRIPSSHGDVLPSGIAELLIIKQQLIRYEAVDIAHIENVLRGERKLREHTRRRETEDVTFRETEITTSEERELESTNRYEMSRETSETIREELSLKAGLQVSGKYGPTVEFAASAEGSFSRTKEEATKSAAEFAQDVTQRSANKVTERVLERASLRVTNEVIEKNSHELSNVGGAGHISGVYQWVNKVYQAQMFNYGLRTMYDFMIPEPAAFLIAAMEGTHASAMHLEKPAPFTLRPDQISEANYHSWVQQYGASGVQPPPEIYKTKSGDFKAGGGDSKTHYTHSGQIQIDEGYRAVQAVVGCVWLRWETNGVADILVGGRTHRFAEGSSFIWTASLDNERDSLPFGVSTYNFSQIVLTVEVNCSRTDRAMEKWRLETHAKLTEAYQARLSEYEEKLAALEMQAGIAIRGRNPGANLELMKDELKKNCISILTEQHFDLFDAVSFGSDGMPQIDLFENAAEGPYVRFFEQAFEWEHMTWVPYPYFWGRRSQWSDRVTYEDPDPMFNQFLKAGYCRVNVPVRLGFEGALDHFRKFGEPWNGGPLPSISDPLYLPIADELAERLQRPGEEIPQGDPWIVRIPTTLIHLRPDDQLPVWVQNANGEWVEQ